MLETLFALDGGALVWIQENLRADWLTPMILTITRLGNTGKIWSLRKPARFMTQMKKISWTATFIRALSAAARSS